MLRQRIQDWLVYFVVRLFICLVQAIRMETCQGISRLLAVVACDVVRLRRNVTDENLQQVYPEWSEAQRRRVTRQMWEHLFLMVCEIAHVPRKIHHTNWRQYVTIRFKRDLVRYLIEPRAIVLVTGHFGNFEVAGYMAGLFGIPTYTIARTLDNPYLDRFINRFRGATGQFMLPKQGSAPQVDAILRAGGTLALLGDQYAGPKGCWVDFLGRPASCHKGLALFALSGGAPLVVTYAKRLDRPLQFELGLEGIADPRQLDESLAGIKPLTQWYNAMLEQIIRRSPEQYWWVHRRWKGAPPTKKKKKSPAAPTNTASADAALTEAARGLETEIVPPSEGDSADDERPRQVA